MYFTINKRNILLWGCVLCVLLSYRFMYLQTFRSLASAFVYGSWAMAILLTCFLYKEAIHVFERYQFIKYYLVYIAISQIVIFAYSMFTYNETIVDMLISAGAYSLLLFSAVLLIGMDEFGEEKYMGMFYAFSVAFLLLRLFDALSVNYLGKQWLSGQLGSKTEFMRAALGPIHIVVMIVFFWRIISGDRRLRNFLVIGLGLLMEFYVQQTRMIQIGLILAFFVMWIFQTHKTSVKLAQVVTVVVLGIILYNFGFFKEVLDSFSSNPEINSSASSTIARLNAIEYFSSFFRSSPLTGMGWVRPKNDRLTLIFSGPNGTAFFDDLGFLGQVFRQGLLGAMIYIALVLRWLFIVIHLPRGSKYKILVWGILTYIVSTAISQNCFDGQRILGTAFFIAIAERAYASESEDSIIKQI